MISDKIIYYRLVNKCWLVYTVFIKLQVVLIGRMMIKLIAFDLDNTLAELGKGMTDEDLLLLRGLEKQGVTIAICSGKPTYYLCGFMRQVGLERPVLLGENGAVLQLGVDLPPKKFCILPYSKEAQNTLSFLKDKIAELLPDIWFQPNLVGVTPFPTTEEEFRIIEKCLEEEKGKIRDIEVYRHSDSFDLVPAGINKKRGMQALGELLDIKPEETIAVGDGVNDYPMFEYAGFSVGVNVHDDTKVDINFHTSTEMLHFLLKMIKKH